MKSISYRTLAALAMLAAATPAMAQHPSRPGAPGTTEEVIIRGQGDLPRPLDIHIDSTGVLINGQKAENFAGSIEVIQRKTHQMPGSLHGFPPMDSFMPGQMGQPFSANKALLGVISAPDSQGKGADIMDVEKGTAAEQAGLRKGDRILKVDGTEITSPQDLSAAIGSHKPGDQVDLRVLRDGKDLDLHATLGRNDNGPSRDFAYAMPFDYHHFFQGNPPFPMQPPFRFNWNGQAPAGGGPHLGMVVENTGTAKGVVVRKVEPGSVAARSGIRPGDIITRYAGSNVQGIDDLRKAVDLNRGQDHIKVSLKRAGKTRNVELRFSAAHQQASF